MRDGLPVDPRSSPGSGIRGGRRLRLRTLIWALTAACFALWALNVTIDPAHSQTPPPTISFRGSATYPLAGNGMVFVGLIGSDAPTGTPDVGGGCDSIHIIAINAQTRSGTILNMPRDSFIGGRKITDICRSGGFDVGIATIKQVTGIPIQFYAHTNFSNFMPLIDALGGLDIHVYHPMFNQSDTGTHFNPGNYHMLGGDTLAFSRDRYNVPGGDFGRSTDQAQIIISSLRKYHQQSTDLSYLFDVIRTGRQRAAFNVPLSDMIRLGLLARQVDPANVKSCTLNGVGQSIGGASVVVLNGDDSAIYSQVAKDGSLPPHPDCFMGVNFEIPSG
jgi:polyisoprenyl-teichoic acid--peptidoglycan teichoic acid transferase